MDGFRKFNSIWVPFNIRMLGDWIAMPYPQLKSDEGDIPLYCVSPNHRLEYVVAKIDDRYIMSMGNGLSYASGSYLNSDDSVDGTGGMLTKEEAYRYFSIGTEIAKYGIKTCKMEYVLELGGSIKLSDKVSVPPILVQYSVECPYRLNDAAFMSKSQIEKETGKWRLQCESQHDYLHLMAAEVLIRNLRILHERDILSNAFNAQCYTWALELCGYEYACSVKQMSDDEGTRQRVSEMLRREVFQAYDIINYISWVLGEPTDYKRIDAMFRDNGFNIEYCKLKLE